ncbi:uncharacterized protein [Linepithema humile]|uniref:uncharacterized protein n=1 Tax=Linepithema humile TaxID=83485 RepID=UPI00351ED32A
MANNEDIIKKACTNNHKNIKKEFKMTSKGRQIIKPKKLLTTSSDEKGKRKKRLMKQKCTNIHEELHDLRQSCSVEPNILKDITSTSNMQKSNQQYDVISEKPHAVNNVLSRSMSMDNSLLHKNSKQWVQHGTNHALPACNSWNNNICNNDGNISLKNRCITYNIDEIPVVLNDDLQKSEAISEDKTQSEIVKLLRQVIKQNLELLSDIKVLKRHHTLTMQNNLYKRPDGFPLKTIEEFENLKADTDRLQELLTYLKFVGGLKLREALSHFQKETMTDELTCKFTYWGRTKESLAFYNTQIAKVFFYAAKMCPNFKGPESRAEFKLEIMEVFRAAKQRQHLRSKSIAVIVEEEEMSDFSCNNNLFEDMPEMDSIEDCDDNTENCNASAESD